MNASQNCIVQATCGSDISGGNLQLQQNGINCIYPQPWPGKLWVDLYVAIAFSINVATDQSCV